jgi:hypothetical protein
MLQSWKIRAISKEFNDYMVILKTSVTKDFERDAVIYLMRNGQRWLIECFFTGEFLKLQEFLEINYLLKQVRSSIGESNE